MHQPRVTRRIRRNRRGNYMMSFAFLLPVMLAMLAFSIDVGRLRVARLKAAAASDAAGLAAMSVIRDGGTQGEAVSAASEMANLTPVLGNTGSGFDVDVDWGAWNWISGGFVPSSSVAGQSAMQIEVTQAGEGFGLLFGFIFSNSNWFGGGSSGGSNLANGLRVRYGRYVALRPRDFVVAVDTSFGMEPHLEEVRSELLTFLDLVDEVGTADDRMALVPFAGAATLEVPLEEVKSNFSDLTLALDDIMPCTVSADAWFYWYRFFPSAFDLETNTSGDYAMDYYAVDPTLAGGEPGLAWSPGTFEASVFVEEWGESIDVTPESWSQPLVDEQMCAAWDWSLMMFLAWDPRREAINSSANVPSMLNCHDGHFYDDPNQDGREEAAVLPAVSCVNASYIAEGLLTYTDPTGQDEVVADRSYTQAGVKPAAGLNAALSIFEAASYGNTSMALGGTVRAEKHVVLITSAGTDCGQWVDEVDRSTCESQWAEEAFLSSYFLDQRDAHVHIIGLVPPNSEDDLELAEYVQGRGDYYNAWEPGFLAEALEDIARDVRVQVVQ